MWEYLLALHLVTAPVDSPIAPECVNLAPLIKQAAKDLELLTYDEHWFMRVGIEGFNFADEVNSLRNRWDQIKDAPVSSDIHRFPSEQTINALMDWNRKHHDYLQWRQAAYPCWRDDLQEQITENDRIWTAYNYVRGAWHHAGWWTRSLLKSLREFVGEDAYWRGRWEPVPRYGR